MSRTTRRGDGRTTPAEAPRTCGLRSACTGGMCTRPRGRPARTSPCSAPLAIDDGRQCDRRSGARGPVCRSGLSVEIPWRRCGPLRSGDGCPASRSPVGTSVVAARRRDRRDRPHRAAHPGRHRLRRGGRVYRQRPGCTRRSSRSLVYALVGPSRILVLGPDSALAPIIAAAVLPLAAGDRERAVALAGLLALMMGAILLVGGLLRLGFVTDLLSKPIRIGYLNGIALVVIVGQLPKLLGFSVDATSFVGEVRGLVDGHRRRRGRPDALVIGVSSLVVIVVLRLLRSRVPGVAVVVVGLGRRHGAARLAGRDPRRRRAAAGPAGAGARRARVGRRRLAGRPCAGHRADRLRRHQGAVAHLRQPGVARPSTAARRWWRSAWRTWPAGSSVDSRCRHHRRAHRSPRRPEPAPSSPASSAPC